MKRVACAILTLAILAAVSSRTHAQRPGAQDRGGERFNPLIRLFDTDQDGILSSEEIAAAAKKLAEFDKSGDGKLTAEELRDAMPFGRGPGMGGPGGPPFGPGGPGREGTLAVSESTLQKEPLAKDDPEKRILDALATMREGPRYRNVSPDDGRLLRMLVETIGAKQVVEIGTSTGESAVWIALGLQKTGGHLDTHEIDESRAKIAQENFKKAGVENLINLILGDAHETVKQHKDPIDILFLDADKEGYIDYLQKLLPLLRPGGLVIAHNMNTRQADPNYLKAITEDPDLETLILLKEGTGVGVTLKKR
jgi:predicted O-methyltransferase YrrM